MSKNIVEIKDRSEFNFRVFLVGMFIAFSFMVFHFEGKTQNFSHAIKLPHVGDTFEVYVDVKIDGRRHYSSRVKYRIDHVDDEEVHVGGIDDNGNNAWSKRSHNPLIGSHEFTSPGIDTGTMSYYGKIKEFFPITPGKNAVFKKIGNTNLGGYFVTELECQVHNKQHVTVPAGHFNAVFVTCYKPDGNEKTFKSRIWYDPHTGLVVKRDTKFWVEVDGEFKRYQVKNDLLTFKQRANDEPRDRRIASSNSEEPPYKVNEGNIETK